MVHLNILFRIFLLLTSNIYTLIYLFIHQRQTSINKWKLMQGPTENIIIYKILHIDIFITERTTLIVYSFNFIHDILFLLVLKFY